ncbi:hypothetical protein OL548_14355 [Lysinibacillus sp. MHQ-1]|nr:hypothetical protein OL548_14355 [Lysinibacillus sp. MHQ-1]
MGALSSMISGLAYSGIAITLSFPIYFISPIAVIVATIVGIIVSLATSKNHVTDNQEFYELIESPLELESHETESVLIPKESN